MVDFTGTWKNQNESTLELRQLAGGSIDGRFESGVGDDNQILWVDISGHALDDVITFHAAFEKYGTIVSWVGQHTDKDGVGQIKTHWLHATNIPNADEPNWLWYTNRIGNDTFVRR
ncbi:MAG: avidin/streptavidin family protein [Mesorhizobium sp.]